MLAGTERNKETHLVFERTKKPKGRKTNIYSVKKEGYILLGHVKFYGAWRQFVFYPLPDTFYNKGCNELINNFLDKVNKRWRNKIKKRKKTEKHFE